MATSMDTAWIPFRTYGVAIHPFQANRKHQISLNFGDGILIMEETAGWYRGRSLRTGEKGIFPAAFIKLHGSKYPTEEELKLMPFHPLLYCDDTSVEIDNTLMEWRKHLKFFIKTKNTKHIPLIKKKITILMNLRKSFFKESLPDEKRISIRKSISKTIDQTNKILMISQQPRTDLGVLANNRNTDGMKLHQLYSQKNIIKEDKQYWSTSLFLSFEQADLEIQSEVELIFSLYDHSKKKIISDVFTIRLDSGMKPIIDRGIKRSKAKRLLQTFFTDLEKSDKSGENLYLLCRINRIGPMVIGRSRGGKIYRRPYGVSVLQLSTDALNFCEDQSTEFQLKVCTGSDQNFGKLHELFLDGDSCAEVHPDDKITVSLRHYLQSLKEVFLIEPKLNKILKTERLSTPSIVLPGVSRNSLYITFIKGDFSHTRARTVQILVQLFDYKHRLIKGIIENGQVIETKKLVVIHNRSDPIWNETVEIVLEGEDFSGYLYIQALKCSSDKSDDKRFNLSFFSLTTENGIQEQGIHTIPLFKPSSRKQEIITPEDQLIVTRNNIEVEFNLCSTLNTQNSKLFSIFDWEEQEDLTSVISEISYLDTNIIVRYFTRIFDSLIAIIGAKGEKIADEVFLSMGAIMKAYRDSARDLDSVVSMYIRDRFSINSRISRDLRMSMSSFYPHLIKIMHDLLENAPDPVLGSKTREALRAFDYFFKFVIHSRSLEENLLNKGISDVKRRIEQSSKMEQKVKALIEARDRTRNEFTTSMATLLHMLNNLMEMTEPAWILSTQVVAEKNLYSFFLDLPKVFSLKKTRSFIFKAFKSIARGRLKLDMEKLKIVKEIASGPLIAAKTSRKEILPLILREVGSLIEIDDLKSAVEIMESILNAVKEDKNLSKEYPEFYKSIKENLSTTDISDALSDIHSDSMIDSTGEFEFEDEKRYSNRKKKRTHVHFFTKEDDEEEDLDKLFQERDAMEEQKLQDRGGKRVVFELSESITVLIDALKASIDKEEDEMEKIRNRGGDPESEISKGLLNQRELSSRITTMILTIFDMLHPQEFYPFILKQRRTRLVDFLTDIFDVFSVLVQRTVYSIAWVNMIRLKHSVILKILTQSFLLCRSKFLGSKYNEVIWISLIRALVNFTISPALQVEGSEEKSNFSTALFKLGDMRNESSELLRSSWGLLGERRANLISCVGDFLSLILLPNREICNTGFDLYYSLLQIEFNSTGAFTKAEQETIHTIDDAMKKGVYKKFGNYYFSTFEQRVNIEDEPMKSEAKRFIEDIKEIVDLILALRWYPKTREFEEERTTAILHLIEYLRINEQFAMLPRYILDLCEINMEAQAFIEAGNTLLMYSTLLTFNDGRYMDSIMKFPRENEKERKIRVLKMSIDMFEKGQDFERAIRVARILKEHYEYSTFEFDQVSKLLEIEKNLFNKIIKQERIYPTFFRVGYYGGFTGKYADLKNREFVYKGDLLEALVVFMGKLKKKFPQAEIKSDDPTQEILENEDQYIQVASVKPSTKEEINGGEWRINVPEFIKKYLRTSDVDVFLYKKPFKKVKGGTNEFRDLWMRNEYIITESTFPSTHRRLTVVKKVIHEVSPVQNAVNSITEKNQEIISMMKKYSNAKPGDAINPFTMVLNGTIDAAVSGGVLMYQQAFLNDEYVQENPENEYLVNALKKGLQEQQEILRRSLQLHKRIMPESMMGLHKNLERVFARLKGILAAFFVEKV